MYFHHSKTRAAETANELLGGFSGILQAAAYAGYNSVSTACTRVGCWAHARQKFVELQNISGEEAGKVLRIISELYKLDRKKTVAERAVIRSKKSQNLVNDLKQYLEQLETTTLPKHPL